MSNTRQRRRLALLSPVTRKWHWGRCVQIQLLQTFTQRRPCGRVRQGRTRVGAEARGRGDQSITRSSERGTRPSYLRTRV